MRRGWLRQRPERLEEKTRRLFPPALRDVADEQMRAGIHAEPLAPAFAEMAGQEMVGAARGARGADPHPQRRARLDGAQGRGRIPRRGARREGAHHRRTRATPATSISPRPSIGRCSSSRRASPRLGSSPVTREPVRDGLARVLEEPRRGSALHRSIACSDRPSRGRSTIADAHLRSDNALRRPRATMNQPTAVALTTVAEAYLAALANAASTFSSPTPAPTSRR